MAINNISSNSVGGAAGFRIGKSGANAKKPDFMNSNLLKSMKNIGKKSGGPKTIPPAKEGESVFNKAKNYGRERGDKKKTFRIDFFA